ncbi:COP9 signalosome catalytic subunit Rri1 [Malassezia pachydermatis]|uniref:COP9 signalosome complex subunit 5 n=1 Tax=Malassezia pachydermatis TaxID=77020 RepID=A0A0M9VMU0_9BASI|nr:cop9 signalosome complex subunit 5 [Malassezia pachydermatis]KOS12633.1 cop9 signalosome complex subunit 5 [Malassezia pachydermatis]
MTTEAAAARTSFEIANGITDSATEALYHHDAATYQALLREAPWKHDPYYFKHVNISVVALLKMVLHARAGGDMEVMGLMQGRVCTETRTFHILDAFALPVEGTETRVNAQNEAYEYMVQYLETCQAVARPEHAIGWYHSHPGYGCWLSGIDVQTQLTNQQQDPFVAIVIDPWRTMSAGHVDIGAFRTLPPEFHADSSPHRTTPHAMPADKAADFGAHASRYYPLDIHYTKLASDRGLYERLWQSYWAHSLTTSPSRTEQALATQQVHAIAAQLRDTAEALQHTMPAPSGLSLAQAARRVPGSIDTDIPALVRQLTQREAEQPLVQAAQHAKVFLADAQHTLLQHEMKAALFGPAD